MKLIYYTSNYGCDLNILQLIYLESVYNASAIFGVGKLRLRSQAQEGYGTRLPDEGGPTHRSVPTIY